MDGWFNYCLSFLRTLLGQLLVAHIGNHMSHELLSTMTSTIRDPMYNKRHFYLVQQSITQKVEKETVADSYIICKTYKSCHKGHLSDLSLAAYLTISPLILQDATSA